MFKYALVAATALAATASAASWPMVTVNSAGDIVLNSPTRAQSFQLTASTVTAAPTSGTTVSLTSVTALSADTDNYMVSVPSTLNTDGGYKLPTPTVGRVITLFNDGTGSGAFTVWTSATSVFFGNSVTSYAVASTDKWVRFTATSTTNWAIETSTSDALSKSSVTISTGSAAATLAVADIKGGVYTYTGTTAAGVALTTPTASAIDAATPGAAVGDSYEFTLRCSSTGAATLTAGTGITFTNADDAFVASGQQVTFMFFRTAAGAYTVIRKSANAGALKYKTLTAATTLTAEQSGTLFYTTTALTMTLPQCTASTLGVTYTFVHNGAATALTIAPNAADMIIALTLLSGASTIDNGALGGNLVLTSAAAYTAAGTTNGATVRLTCVVSTAWDAVTSSNAAATVA
eukprot:CAMPEP_0205822488 /NCGR_PEP_ID=MMETSP0206-20130828/12699_1 /ASSEMBLY_ACC=CAM_ASM_000279 /TAXON_ID=36767 /ORGANISM="Euplotes focardii, Strain TN1" /LENGTH=404 /DNA_ID=CAMNT_0053118795 /DNA_START=21 /DNA_END=1235 /DNA_ORIENTATION=+